MSIVVKRVALAIKAVANDPSVQDYMRLLVKTSTSEHVENWMTEQMAAAAINAMQKPTSDMLEAGEYWIGKHAEEDGGFRMDVNHAYQDMIGVALNGLPPWEWKAMSEWIAENAPSQGEVFDKTPEDDGWEIEGGALRRPIKAGRPNQNEH